MPSYKLTYFDMRGRAETTRLAFTLAGIPFEDFRVAFSDWPALKPKIFTGQMPILEVDGKPLSESTAIARYVAREGGLLGSNNFEQAKIEAVADALNVLMNEMACHRQCPEGAIKESLHKQLHEKNIPGIISLLETFLGDKEFFVLDKLTLAELHFYSVFSNIKECAGLDWEDLSPKLTALYQRVEKEPKIAAYLSKKA